MLPDSIHMQVLRYILKENNTNFTQITGIQEKLDTIYKENAS